MIVLALSAILGLVLPSTHDEAEFVRLAARLGVAEQALPSGIRSTGLDVDGELRLREFFLAENLNEVDEDGEAADGSLALEPPVLPGPPRPVAATAVWALAPRDKATTLRLRGTVQLRL